MAPSDEQTTLQAMAAGLNPTEGKNATEKIGPLVALVLLVALSVVESFGVIPNPGALDLVTDMLLVIVGAWTARLGAKL